MRIRWHRLARRDLRDLRAYIARDNPTPAARRTRCCRRTRFTSPSTLMTTRDALPIGNYSVERSMLNHSATYVRE
jgi:plasmid stabilization system protein ParE